MVSVVDIIQLFVMIGVNTAITALMTRFFRVRLETSWGPVVFSLLLIPVVLLALTQIMGGVGFGFNIGSARLVVGLLIVLPIALGLTFDYFWMPAPEDVNLPAKYQ